jgi:hypothetical protein
MKVLLDYCTQPRAYADSRGHCVIELEDGDNVSEIKARYTAKKEWYEKRYSAPYLTDKFVYRDKTYTGKLLVFNTHRVYLD